MGEIWARYGGEVDRGVQLAEDDVILPITALLGVVRLEAAHEVQRRVVEHLLGVRLGVRVGLGPSCRSGLGVRVGLR